MQGIGGDGFVINMPSGFKARKILRKFADREVYYICVWNDLTQISCSYTQETIDTLQNGTHNVYKAFTFWKNFQTIMNSFMVENLDNFKSMAEDGEYNWEWVEQETSKIISEIVESQEESDDV